MDFKPALLMLFLTLGLSPARAAEVGLDGGALIWQGVHKAGAHDAVASTGVLWVRVNFRLDLWSAPDDATPRGPGKQSWYQAYDAIVDGFLARGIQVYGLVNDEAVSGIADRNSPAFVDAYLQSALKIVEHFKERVRIFEIVNEPNDWAGGTTARFQPATFAKILERTYLAVKHEGGHQSDPCWREVQLISGPLFSFDDTAADDYLKQVYAIGRQQLGWEGVKATTGSYPLDGVGYHLYVAQGAGDSLATVRTRTLANLGALWSVVAANEGAATGKRIWVSEYGWRADVVGADGQADRLEAGFEAMKESGQVALALYFQLQDFPDNAWGVFSEGGLDPAHRRKAADRLLALGAANRPTHAAHLLVTGVPKLAAGAQGELLLSVENRGSSSWSGPGWRLGAGPGCPTSTAANAIGWEPASGYAKSQTDARLYLPAAVPPGGKATLALRVRAPSIPGSYRFAARMLEEGVTWFGTTAVTELQVTAALPGDGGIAGEGGRRDLGPADGGLRADPPPTATGGDSATRATGGCGCRLASAPEEGMLLFVLGLGLALLRRWRGRAR